MKTCANFKKLMVYQSKCLMEHLNDHKYYLGEKGIQLDGKELERDFIESYYNMVCCEMRCNFCANICTVDGCKLREKFLEKDG